jgi:hypothetical protein
MGLENVRISAIPAGGGLGSILQYARRHVGPSKVLLNVPSNVRGKTKNPKEIIVDGCAFLVLENLGVTLQHLQYNDSQPAIWDDAICINKRPR